ncbi:hypothetical protein PTQ19_10230 [Microbacterium esteraromaticum]|uniref:hypothetical protein n=1 Tax=Microbacterium esteraromaticum TaxID=57043 RepID=UPI002368D7F8|nr:hypothetical protein [Microbacterium esteraromaticum]WDH77898.1 hypothetical protein PTQ19_10230 [Microbacterium esteraromaticum]
MASVAAWSDFKAKLDATEGRAVAAEGGGGSALGFANLSLVFLAVDECERHLASRRGTVDHWVQTHQGAADAVMFSHAAARAWDALPVEPREERPVAPQRCPDCGFLSVYGHVSRKSRKGTVIDCRNCGYELDVVPTHVDRWAGSATCEHQLHTDCTNLNCGCPCHNVGAKSRPAGAQALWDADQFMTSPDVRAGWEIRDHLTIEPTKETRAA